MIFGESLAKDAYRGLVWGPGRRLLEAGPPTTELRTVRLAGRAAAALLPGKRARIRDNLARAFPGSTPAWLDGVARQAFAAHFSNQYASFAFPGCTAATWPRYLRIDGLHHLEEALSRGAGVVLAHPHMGPAQLPLHVLGLQGLPMHQVGGGRVTLVELSAVGRWAARTRAELEGRMPVTLFDGRGYLRPVLRALTQGGVVMTAADATGGGEELGRRVLRTVLGQSLPLPLGAVRFAWLSGAPLLTVHCHRNPEGGLDQPAFVAQVGPELVLPREEGRARVMAVGADLLAAWLDATLRAWPGDWLFWDGFEPGGLLPEESP